MRWNRAYHFEYDGKSMETETRIWSEFPNKGKAIVEQILASEEINKLRANMRNLLTHTVYLNIVSKTLAMRISPQYFHLLTVLKVVNKNEWKKCSVTHTSWY